MAKTINQDDKVLVVCYSKAGNTKVIAEQIRQLTGGDIVEIEPEKAYPDDYRQLTELAKDEISESLKPTLKTKVENFKDYVLSLSVRRAGGVQWHRLWLHSCRKMVLPAKKLFRS